MSRSKYEALSGAALLALIALSDPAGAQGRPSARPAAFVRAPRAVVLATGLPGNVIKTVTDLNGGTVLRGDTLVYDVAVTNVAGPDDALIVALVDTIPVNTTYVPGSLVITSGPSAGSKTDATGDDQAFYEPVQNRVRFRLGTGATAALNGTLVPDASTSVRFRVVVNAGAASGTVLSNSAVARYRDGGTMLEMSAPSRPPGGPVGGAPTTVTVELPDLTIAKTHSGNFTRGSSGAYALVVTNLGPGQTAGTVTVSDVVPAGFTPTAASGTGWSCTISAQTVTCTRTTSIAAAAAAPAITLSVDVLLSAPGSVTNTATVSGGGESNAANNSASDPTTIIGSATDVSIAKSHVGNFVALRQGTFTLAVTNTTAASTPGPLTVTDTLPNGLTFVSGTGPGWSCTTAAQVVTCTNPGPIGPNATTSVALLVDVGAPAWPGFTNRAWVDVPGDAVAGNNVSTDPVIVESIPDMTIVKSASGAFVVGANASYDLLVTNVSGGATFGAITVTDTLPNGLTFVAGTGAGWVCGSVAQVVTCTNPGPIGAGGTSTIALSVAVGAAAAPSVTNRAHVTSPGDVNTGNNASTVTTPVTAPSAADLTITKTHTGNFVVGQNHTWTLRVTNVGTAPFNGTFTLVDTLPGGITFVSGPPPCPAAGQVITCTVTTPLNVGVSTQATITVAVGAAAVPGVVNRAHLSSPGDGNPANNSATDPTTVLSIPDLAIAKVANGAFAVGSNATYTVTVSNVSSGSTTGAITITDILPVGLTFVSGTGTGWTCSAVGQTVTCTNAGPLGAGASSAITLTVAVGAAAAPSVTNTATVSTPGDFNPGNDTASVVTPVTVPGSPDLAIAKSHTGNFVAGQNGTWTLAITNVGAAPTTGAITVTDTLPSGLTFVSGIGAAWSCSASAQVVTCTSPGPIAAAGSTSIVLTAAVGAAALPGVTNRAHVGTPGDTNPTNDSATDPTTVVSIPDLAIAKVANGAFAVGANASYTLTVTNVSSGSTTGAITVTDVLPAGLTFVSGTGSGWTCGAVGQAVTCSNPGPIAAGGTSAVTLTVAVALAAAPSVTNTATVSTPGDLVPANNASTVTTTVPNPSLDLSIAKTAASAFVAGQHATYQLAVANVSALPTTAVTTIGDVLPNGITFVAASGAGFSCSAAGQAVTCTYSAVIPAGQTVTVLLTVAVAPTATGTLTNTATVSTPGDANPGNDSSTVATPVSSGVDLALAKSAGALAVGTAGTFTLTVSNVGSAPASGPITITDNLPAGLTFVSGTGGGFACTSAGQLVTCTRTTPLAPGQSAAVQLVVNVGSAAIPSIVNTATVSTPGDANPGNNTGSTGTVPVSAPSPDIGVTKALASAVVAGANATFRITVSNVGTGPTSGPITITDQLQPGLTYVGSAGAGWTCSTSGQMVTCTNPGPLAAGATTTLDLVVAIAANVTSVGNTAVGITSGDGNGGNNTGVVPPTPTALPPDLALAKVASGNFVVGQPATYTITVRNVGAGPTVGPITVTDLVPAGLTVNGATGAGWTCSTSGQQVTCTNPGPLAPNASSTFTITVTPIAAAVPSVTNTAHVSTPGDGNGGNDDGTAITPVAGVVDLALDKQGSDSLTLGAVAAYTLTVRNVGNVATTGAITLVDSLPVGLTFVSASGPGFSCSSTAPYVTCTRTTPPLGAGQSVTIDLTVSVSGDVAAAVRNAACVKTPTDGNTANDCSVKTSTPAGAVDLVAIKDVIGPVDVGKTATFTLSVRNLGAAPARAPITVVDTLPNGLTFVSAVGPGWQCGATGNTVTCIRPTALPPGQAATVTLVTSVTAAAVPRVTNCMSVRGTNETALLGNNRSCIDPIVQGGGKLEIEKRVSRAEVEVGDVVDYTVAVKNTGAGDVNDAIVTDVLPAGFLLEAQSVRVNGVSGAPVTGAPGPRVTIEVGRIAAGAQATVTYRVRVGPGTRPGTNVNVATAASKSGGGTTPQARATVTVSGGVFDERGAIVGKVYIQCDCDGNALQDAGEIGIPGVRVFIEDGTSAVTDVEGKYSFYNVTSRLHVVKVDRTTLPDGAVLVPLVNRNAGDGYTRFADVKAGELHRADFADGSRSADLLKRVLERRREGEVNRAGADGSRPMVLATGGAVSVPGDTGARSFVQTITTAAAGTGQPGSQRYAPLFQGAVLNENNSQLPVTPLRARMLQAGTNPSNGGLIEVRTLVDGDARVAPADGQTRVIVHVLARDGQGNARRGRTPVTLEASLGRWIGSDLGGTEPGLQATLENGKGTFVLIAAAQPGHGEVRATTPDASTTVQMTFVPVNRPMLVMGLVNARVDFLKLVQGGLGLAAAGDGFEEALRDWSFDNDSGTTRGGARAALLLKGTVLDNRLLTLSYDSERDRGRTFFRDIRPEEFFPVYGDASIREFDAQSRRRFYARLDKGTNHTMYGDFQTARADDRRMLSAYDRSLTGAVQHLEGTRGSATLFASQGRISQAVDEIAGRGISGPYALTRATGLINSERVEVIVRDRNQPSVILSRTPMTRFADYTIEPVTGRILFRAPVASADANLNPVSIRVTYETENGQSDAFWVYGFNGSVRPTDKLELGGTFARDGGPATSHQLIGLNATARLGASTTLLGEFAHTEDAGGATGDAQRLELRHQSAALDARVFAIRSDAAFSNQSSIYSGGRTELGGRFSRQLAEGTRLVGEAIRSGGTGGDGRRDGALLAIERQFSPALRGELGYRYAKDNRPTTVIGNPNAVAPDRDVSAVRARVQWTLPQQTRSSLFGEVEQDVRNSDQRRLAVGGEYIIANRARLYGRHEVLTGLTDPYTPSPGSVDRQYTVFGIDADYLKNTQMFSEYRARDAFGGRDAEASIGLRNRWAIAPGLLVNTSFERVSPIVATDVVGTTHDALAVTGAVEWTRPALWKSTARLEFRDAETGDNTLASFGYARKLSRDWTLLGRTLWDDYDAAQRQTRGFSQLGLAWRQTDRNRWNALARYEQRFERIGPLGVQAGTRDLAHILAAMVNVQPVQRFIFSGRYAAKTSNSRVNGLETNTTAQLLMARGVLDLTSRFDAGLITSTLFSDGFSDRRYGLGGELGLIAMKNLRVVGGYNLFGFTDRDLSAFGTTRKGPYLELGFKFDESLFGIGGDAKAGAGAGRDGGNRE